jgi:ferric-dicitrate binding protein FerR (iron transport regulator)
MSPNEPELTSEEARARDAVRALGGVKADAAFRERLRADFIEGCLAEAGDESSAALPERAPRRGGWRWPRILVPAFAAALLLLALATNRGPEFAVVDVSGAVTVDGQVYDSGDRAGLAAAVRSGSRLELAEGSSLAVAIPGKLVIELVSATATVPASPGRWIGRSTESRLESGEIRILTGPDFRGDRYDVETPDGLIRVTGTLVSAVRDEGGTCVCVRHGTAQVGRSADELAPVPPGKRMVLYADRREPLLTEIAPPHEQYLLDFEARHGERALGSTR